LNIDYERREIARGVYLNIIKDKRFNSNFASVLFITPFSKEEASARAFVPGILSVSNANYPTRAELNRKLLSLYNASLNTSSVVSGNNYITGYYASCINDKNAFDGENVTEETVRLMVDCILNPKVVDGVFDPKEFAILKQELIDTIDTEINNKRGYALTLANEIIFRDEPVSVRYYGTKAMAQALTNERAYEIYLDTLHNADIEITIAGDGIEASAKFLEETFSELERPEGNNIIFYDKSPLKAEVETVDVKGDVQQTRLVMAYKGDSKNVYVDKLMTAMFGGVATSKLFMNVREKLQLCYSCNANYKEYKNTLIVESGIDAMNLDVAIKEIDIQLKAIAQGDFTDEELYNTKLMISGAFKSNYDSLFALGMWYDVQHRRGTCYTPDEVIEIFHSITREQIMECAGTYKLDTVFTLSPEV